MMLGLKAMLALERKDKEYFLKYKGTFKYNLWFEEGFFIFMEKFNSKLIKVSLKQKPPLRYNHINDINDFIKLKSEEKRILKETATYIVVPFGVFLKIFDEVEFTILLNTKIPVPDKPLRIWKELKKRMKKEYIHEF